MLTRATVAGGGGVLGGRRSQWLRATARTVGFAAADGGNGGVFRSAAPLRRPAGRDGSGPVIRKRRRAAWAPAYDGRARLAASLRRQKCGMTRRSGCASPPAAGLMAGDFLRRLRRLLRRRRGGLAFSLCWKTGEWGTASHASSPQRQYEHMQGENVGRNAMVL